jgi:hypothetical protein
LDLMDRPDIAVPVLSINTGGRPNVGGGVREAVLFFSVLSLAFASFFVDALAFDGGAAVAEGFLEGAGVAGSLLDEDAGVAEGFLDEGALVTEGFLEGAGVAESFLDEGAVLTESFLGEGAEVAEGFLAGGRFFMSRVPGRARCGELSGRRPVAGDWSDDMAGLSGPNELLLESDMTNLLVSLRYVLESV